MQTTYRYLLPALAEAGYRAVARFTAGSPRPSFPMTYYVYDTVSYTYRDRGEQ